MGIESTAGKAYGKLKSGLAEVAGTFNASSGLTEIANTTCFFVTIDMILLGAFDSVKGLGVKYTREKVGFGGQHDWQPLVIGNMEHTDLELQRPMTWQTNLVQTYIRYFNKRRTKGTMTIEAFHNDGSPIAAWSFVGVVPIVWNGPAWNLAVGNAGIAYENITLAHEGFL